MNLSDLVTFIKVIMFALKSSFISFLFALMYHMVVR